jgi:hypothetical protein
VSPEKFEFEVARKGNAAVCTGVDDEKGVDPSKEKAVKVSVAPGKVLEERARGVVCVLRHCDEG